MLPNSYDPIFSKDAIASGNSLSLSFSLFYLLSFLNSFFFFVYSLAKQLVLVGCTLLIEKRRA